MGRTAKGYFGSVLKLKIENCARLSDGGPLSYQVERRGFDIGRDQHLDWTLPDPTRHISGKHCEIRFFDGAYWLYDVSTNGTFVNKSTRRVQSPYKLADGDEVLIGDYIISVSVAGSANRPAPAPVPERVLQENKRPENIWTGVGEPPAPINPQDLLLPVQRHGRAADFLNSVANIPAVSSRHSAAEQSFHHDDDPWAVSRTGAERPPGVKRESFANDGSDQAWITENAVGLEAPPPVPSPDLARRGPAPDRNLASPHSREAKRIRDDSEFIRQFAAAANIPEDVLAGRDGGELAREMGLLLRIVCTNLMQLLGARAAAKTLARSGNRTLIKAVDNNPLKFMPTAEEALKIMLGPRSESYLDATRTLEQSFADLKAHQLGVLSAMQLAAAQLLEELSPEAIEQSGGGAKKPLLGTNKAKLWENYVERWKGKSGHHEHGMLGEFLDLFAKLYDQETRQKR
jgi:type VI secretion system protein ImpI